MRSLRSRLTIAYAVVTFVALGFGVFAVLQVAFEITIRPIEHAVEATALRARVIASDPTPPTDALLMRIRDEAPVEGAHVMIPPGLRYRMPFEKPGVAVFEGPVFGGPPRPLGFVLPPGALSVQAKSEGDFGPPPRPGGPVRFEKFPFFGLHDEVVPVRNTGIVVLPDIDAAQRILRGFTQLLAVSLAVALVVSLLVARWVAAQAVEPLARVTSELRRFAAGDFTQRPVTTKDRTELGELIEAYNGATAQVAAAFSERERVEAQMRRFVGDAGHELRTPLTAIVGYHQLLERGGYENPSIRERAFATLTKETRRMRLLVERLVSLARLERPEPSLPSDVDLVELTRDAVASVQDARGGNVILRASGEIHLSADAMALEIAVTNLVDNALKYGGDADVTVDVTCDAERAQVRVTDQGPGIAPADRPRIFERFYRGDHGGSIEGSGLGLSIAARAAERAGGRIVLESADPGNTVFSLVIPSVGTRSVP